MDIKMVRSINEELAAGRPVALLRIMATCGSTPRKAGSAMLVFRDGPSLGTIGGGLLEGRALALAREVLAARASAVLKMSMDAEVAALEGMACGGAAEVLAQYIDPADF